MHIISFLEYIKESQEEPTKKELKRLKYFVKKKPETIEFKDLDRFNIPDSIKEMMRTWPVIQKSPYSNSFYSSKDIFWGSKPEGSYRVSDHWNFISNYDTTIKHCATSNHVPNNSHISIGQFHNGKYDIILSEPTKENTERLLKSKERLKYLMDPETLQMKKKFKTDVLNGEIYCKVIDNGEFSGRVVKYTGSELKVADDSNKLIYNNNYVEPYVCVTLYKDNEEINNPFDK